MDEQLDALLRQVVAYYRILRRQGLPVLPEAWAPVIAEQVRQIAGESA